MAQRGKSSRGKLPSQAEVKDARSEAKRLLKQSKELLRRANKDVRQVRHEVSVLKKQGAVAPYIKPRSYRPTRYMLTKLKKFEDVLSGRMVAVKAPRKVREAYTEKGIYEARGGVLIVPKESAKQKTRISRGLVEVTERLKNGQAKRLILPYKMVDMEQLVTRLETDPTLDGLKQPDEMFGFRLFGHNMRTFGFPNAHEMGEYIRVRYQHLFSGRNNHEAPKHLMLMKFLPDYDASPSGLPEGPEEEKVWPGKRKYKSRRQRRIDYAQKQRLKRDALRKQEYFQKETEQQRQKRLAYARDYSRKRRQAEYAKRIEKKTGL